MKTYSITSLLVLTLLAISCVHSPLGMENEQDPNPLAPAAQEIASPQDEQEYVELNWKEQAALDKELLRAAQAGNTATVASALERGANIEAKTYGGRTALHEAAEKGHLEVTQLLLDRGANIEAKTQQGKTALQQVAYWQNLKVVRLLLARGANIERRSLFSISALDWAINRACQDAATVLNAYLVKQELEELQLAPTELNQLIVNMGYGEGRQ
jgi:ankyrin repeat protein